MNEKVVTSRDHTPRCFASFRVAAKRLVVDALLNFEGSDRFGVVSGFVNVSRHCDNLLVNELGAFLFGKRKVLRWRITLGNARLICRLISQGVNLQIGHFPWIEKSDMESTVTLSQRGALYRAHHRVAKRRCALFRRFAATARIQPPDIYRRTFADAHVSRRFHPDNGR